MTNAAARRRAFYEASRPLFEELALKPGDIFELSSRSRAGKRYEMTVTPEGFVVHQGLGCESEEFNPPDRCWHVRESEKYVTQSLTTYQPSQVPSRIDFSAEQLRTITDVICTDYQGNKAPPQFVQLFLSACRHSGLDPFLRQIYALNIQGKWTMFVGIDGYRVISERTGLDEGMDGPQWSNDGQDWFDFPFVEEPAFARVGIWRKGVPRPFVAVVTMKAKKIATSSSWKQDPSGMLAKCAEALARRRAFPADMAVIPDTAVFDDADGTPITRAEVPEGSYRIVEEPETPAGVSGGAVSRGDVGASTAGTGTTSPKASPAQITNLMGIWRNIDKGSDPAAKLRARFPKAFPIPGTGGVPTPNVLSADEADEAIALLSAKPACEHPNPAYDENATVVKCTDCGAVLEGPDSDAVQEPML